MKFNEEQIALLLSAFWMQANLSDNLPSNFEAIAHSFVLALISSGLKVKYIFEHSTCLFSVNYFVLSFLLLLFSYLWPVKGVQVGLKLIEGQGCIL